MYRFLAWRPLVCAASLMAGLCCVLAVAVAQDRPKARRAEKKPAAQSEATKPSVDSGLADIEAIRRASDQFVAAFDKGDAQAVAAHWKPDGDYSDESGRTFNGRAEIEQEYARFFAEHPGAKLRLTIDAVRLLSDSTAIEDGRAVLDPPPSGAPSISKYTVVHVKLDGNWLMATVRDTRVETASHYRHLQDLEWLVGSWTAEEHGATTAATCRWVANKSFVERSYTVTHADASITSGIQMIGWNPQTGRIQSWNFSSDGGHAIGNWTARENGWAIETTGVSGSAGETRAVNLLTRLDDNAYAWQSVGRSAAGKPLPDTDEVVLKRRTAGR